MLSVLPRQKAGEQSHPQSRTPLDGGWLRWFMRQYVSFNTKDQSGNPMKHFEVETSKGYWMFWFGKGWLMSIPNVTALGTIPAGRLTNTVFEMHLTLHEIQLKSMFPDPIEKFKRMISYATCRAGNLGGGSPTWMFNETLSSKATFSSKSR